MKLRSGNAFEEWKKKSAEALAREEEIVEAIRGHEAEVLALLIIKLAPSKGIELADITKLKQKGTGMSNHGKL